MNQIGIMQGRLSPPRAHLQSFPWSDWREEFTRARALGFDTIEWLFDTEDHERNPLWPEGGLHDIHARMEETGIAVSSVCATYFSDHPLFRVAPRERQRTVRVLNELVQRTSALGAQVILLPVLEDATIQDRSEGLQLLESLLEPLDVAHSHGIALALESDLPAREQVALLIEGDHPALGCYYDTGNAAAAGHDVASDLEVLGPFLRGIHLKDRPRGGPNVPLGDGAADFGAFFSKLGSLNYIRPLILETTPGNDYYENARRNLEFVKSFLARTVA